MDFSILNKGKLTHIVLLVPFPNFVFTFACSLNGFYENAEAVDNDTEVLLLFY